MPEQKPIEIGWPLQGVNRSRSYEDQPPNTCLDAENVRPDDNFALRDRGGSRPTLSFVHTGLGERVQVSNSAAGAPSFSAGFSTVNADSVTVTNVTQSLYQSGDRTRIFMAGGPFLENQVGRMLKDDDLSRSHRIQSWVSANVIYVEGDASDFAGACTIEPFNSGMVGAWITFPSGRSYRITSYTDSTTVVVAGGASDEATGNLFVTDSAVTMLGQVRRSLDVGAVTATTVWREDFKGYGEGNFLNEGEGGWTRSSWFDGVDTKWFFAIEGISGEAQYHKNRFDVDQSSGMHQRRRSPAVDVNESQNVLVFFVRGVTGSSTNDIELSIFLRMGDSSPNGFQNGYQAKLLYDASESELILSLHQFINGSEIPVTSTEAISYPPFIRQGRLVRVTLGSDDKTLTIDYDNGATFFSHTFDADLSAGSPGTRIGVVMDNVGALAFPGGNGSALSISSIEHSYVSLEPDRSGDSSNQLVVGAGGSYYTNAVDQNVLIKHSTSLSVSGYRMILSADHLQKLYIADHGNALASGSTLTSRGTVSNASPCILTHDVYDEPATPNWFELGINTDDYVCHITEGEGDIKLGTYPISVIAPDGSDVTLAAKGNGDRANESGGSLNVSYTITRGAKVYDPLENTISLLSDSIGGILPTRCSIVVMFQDRVFWAGDQNDPGKWYASRRGNGSDYDFGADSADPAKATTEAIGDVGGIGDDITALVVASSDYLVFGGRQSLWVFRGDPSRGGAFVNLSRKIGIFGRKSWCITPEGAVVFMSLAGIYAVAPGSDAKPLPVSEDILPAEFLNLDPLQVDCLMEYDIQFHGIHIYLSPRYGPRTDFDDEFLSKRHWWLSWKHKGFWPLKIPQHLQPLSIISYSPASSGRSSVLLGGRKGHIAEYRRGEFSAESSLESYIIFGPFDLYADGYEKILASIEAELGTGSADITWEVFVAKTPQQAADKALDVSSTPDATGTWSEQLSYRSHPRVVGGGMCIKLKRPSTDPETSSVWAMEKMTLGFVQGGRRRK